MVGESGLFYSFLSSCISYLNKWWLRRHPQVVVALVEEGRAAIARVATFGRPVFVRAVRFRFPEKGNFGETVDVNQILAPHAQLDCLAPRNLMNQFTLTVDMAVSVLFKSESGNDSETDALLFNVVGTNGVAKIYPYGKYLAFSKCPKCGESWFCATDGIKSLKQLTKRKRAFEKDMKRTCPNHDESRKKFWVAQADYLK